MNALKFTLHGAYAHFKNPCVNSTKITPSNIPVLSITYGNIHKPALLGILGAKLGLGGYKPNRTTLPDYYLELQDLEIAIVPNRDGAFSRFMNDKCDFTGFSGNGATLMVKEQWLQSPSWDIYIKVNGHKWEERLKDVFLNQKSKFLPYLGKNHHAAYIQNVEIVDLCKMIEVEKVDSLVPSKNVTLENFAQDGKKLWSIFEYLPVGLNSVGLYIQDEFLHTSSYLEINEGEYWQSENRVLSFI